MVRMAWDKISHHWSLVFTAAVAIWFVLSALSFPNMHVSNPWSSDSASSSAPAPEPAPEPAAAPAVVETKPKAVKVNGAAEVQVKSFHLDTGNRTPTGEVTLQVKNNAKSNIEFQPGSLALRQIGGSLTTPAKIETSQVAIAPGRSVIVPVTFPITSVRPGSTYELTYAGNSVYTGKPL